MSVPREDRWTTGHWERQSGRYWLEVMANGVDYDWLVWDARRVLASGKRPDEKAAKLAARRWVESATR